MGRLKAYVGSEWVTIATAGPPGPEGPEGPQGPEGIPYRIFGTVDTVGDLPPGENTEPGEGYVVEENGELYFWFEDEWVSVGKVVGPAGPVGPPGPDAVQVSPEQPTDPAIELWYDTDAPATGMYDRKIGPPGHWVFAWPAYGWGASAPTVNQVCLVRIAMEQAFDAAAIRVEIGVPGSSFVVGIYNVDANGLPTTLAAQCTLDASAVANKTGTFGVTLPPGMYWCAYLPLGGAPQTYRSQVLCNLIVTPTPAITTMATGAQVWALNSQSSLPSPFPVASAGGSNAMAVIELRLA